MKLLIISGVMILALCQICQAQGVSYHTISNHNSFVAINTPPFLNLKSVSSDFPNHYEWIIKNSSSIYYTSFGIFASWNSNQTPKILVDDPQLRKVRAVSDRNAVYALKTVNLGKSASNKLTTYEDNKKIWELEISTGYTPIFGIPTLSKEAIYLASKNKIFSISAADGKINWTKNFSVSVCDVLSVSSGIVLVNTQAGLYALSTLNGNIIWQNKALASANHNKIAVTDGKIICLASANGSVTTLKFDTGKLLWSKNINRRIDERHPPIIGSSEILIPLIDGLLLLGKDGNLFWQRSYNFISKKASNPFFLMTQNMIFAAGDGLYAISLADGTILWKTPWNAEVDGLQYYDGGLYLTARDRTLKVYSWGK